MAQEFDPVDHFFGTDSRCKLYQPPDTFAYAQGLLLNDDYASVALVARQKLCMEAVKVAYIMREQDMLVVSAPEKLAPVVCF